MEGLELHWSKCLDGAEVVEGTRIRFRSSEIGLYEARVSDLRESMLERYVRCERAEDFAGFVSEYGLPGAVDMNATEQELRNLVSVRDGLRGLLAKRGELSYEAAKAFNTVSLQLRPALTPLFTIWKNPRSPSFTFQPKNPDGFMLMQAALALSNAVALETCRHCTLPFLAGPLTGKRLGAYYCTNRCRVAAQRAEAKRRSTVQSKRKSRGK